MALSQNKDFVKQVIDFIDQPLSPTSLRNLREKCKTQAQAPLERDVDGSPAPMSTGAAAGAGGYAGGGGGARSYDLPMGTDVETYGLTQNLTFNGMRGVVVGYEGPGKVLIEFDSMKGKIFDINPANIKRVASPWAALAPPPPPPAPPAPEPAAPSYIAARDAPAPAPAAPPPPPPPQARAAPQELTGDEPLVERVAVLVDQLRCALTHVETAATALDTAVSLYIADPEALYTTLAEFQPQLPRDTIRQSWRRIVEIYQEHAARARQGDAPAGSVVAAGSARRASPIGAPAPSVPSKAEEEGDLDIVQQLEGVLNFISEPLSPRTLKGIRTVKKKALHAGGSPL